MLESVEVLPGARDTLRRVVRIPCDLVSETFDEPVELEITDLSAHGAFIETSLPLEDGEELELAFEVPRTQSLVAVRARVKRAALNRRRQDARSSGMGLEFVDLSDRARDWLDGALVGMPPRLPEKPRAKTPARAMHAKPSRRAKKLVWVDSLHDWGDVDPTLEIESAIERATALRPLHRG
jgi:hypothetical protein